MRVCCCGQDGECPGTCAGAQLQALECAIVGHLTASRIHEQAWGREPTIRLAAGEYCYRCGDEGE